MSGWRRGWGQQQFVVIFLIKQYMVYISLPGLEFVILHFFTLANFQRL